MTGLVHNRTLWSEDVLKDLSKRRKDPIIVLKAMGEMVKYRFHQIHIFSDSESWSAITLLSTLRERDTFILKAFADLILSPSMD
jgi:hypothetical protein